MDEPRGPYAELYKPDRKRQILPAWYHLDVESEKKSN